MSGPPPAAPAHPIAGLACLRCRTTVPVGDYDAGCPACAAEGHASNLRVIYHGDPGPGVIALPFPEAPSLGEGATPELDAPDLADEIGLGRLSLKLEWCNPTGSHKDRMSAQLMAR